MYGLHIIVLMHSEGDFMAFMLRFLDPDFEKESPTDAAIEWTGDWEEEQDVALKTAMQKRDIPAMMRAARARHDSVYEWNPELFIVFGKRKLWSIQRKLRAYIDEWIDTGFQSDGSERPTRRNFKPRFRGEVEGSSTSRPKWDSPPEAFLPPPNAVAALAKLHRGKAIPIGLHYDIEFEKENSLPVQMRIDPRGGIDYFLRREWSGSSAELRAAQIFYWFYRSSFVFLLMRCNRCKALTVPRTKPRKRYERGWHCDNCRNSAAALAATASKRGQLRERWFALAIDACVEYGSQSRRSTHDVCAFITERVNRSLPYSNRIKRNTITRNLKEIQAQAESKGENRHAKS